MSRIECVAAIKFAGRTYQPGDGVSDERIEEIAERMGHDVDTARRKLLGGLVIAASRAAPAFVVKQDDDAPQDKDDDNEPKDKDEPKDEGDESQGDDEPKEADDGGEYPRHTGRGWWLLSDGEKVRGEDEAIAAEAALHGDEPDDDNDEEETD